MTALAEPITPSEPVWSYPPSPAGPAEGEPLTARPPDMHMSGARQGIRFAARPLSFAIGAHRRFGDVWTLYMPMRPGGMVITAHPDHLQSLLKAKPADAPSLTGDSPLGPILGPNSVLTAVGDRHMRQRKLLLPPFHGEAVARYVDMISEVAEAEIDRWQAGDEFALAPRMQAVTLEVIMRGVFGVDDLKPGTREYKMSKVIQRLLSMSATPLYQVMELRNHGSKEPKDLLAAMLRISDRHIFAAIRARREDPTREARHDVLSLMLEARDEDGQALTDQEIRDELMALLLAGHETTANTLSWTVERLLRTPAAYDDLRDAVRGGDEASSAEYVEATIHEGMRVRPVIPMIVRMVKRPWRFGEYVVPANTATGVSILGLHHRSDIYPGPNAFRPERFLGRKPGTYTWIPFGGGIRRCLGASLAMAEQRLVLEAIARRTDLVAPNPEPEHARMRNVTMIPGRGGRIRVVRRRDR
jgi:cytochrome P450